MSRAMREMTSNTREQRDDQRGIWKLDEDETSRPSFWGVSLRGREKGRGRGIHLGLGVHDHVDDVGDLLA
jgi:hypothetical protein